MALERLPIILQRYHQFPSEVRQFIKSECLWAIRDPSLPRRAYVDILITTIASRGELSCWPELLPTLSNLLDSTDYNVCEGTFGVLKEIYEDSDDFYYLTMTDDLNYLIPKFLQLLSHTTHKIRSHSISCINQFILSRPQALIVNIDAFIEQVEIIRFGNVLGCKALGKLTIIILGKIRRKFL
ncbi:hypothetical protein QYM36_008128 [Artemia franciscana]|uniref:Uncharacterized protein n=1 Tax=Artemia franciscana TaxID=6661 RepID=A0AA88IFT0_ARTSF|nr:hypothetical protein QYM36_008128 [Artemia franciscana]